jgi:hypothetical protein
MKQDYSWGRLRMSELPFQIQTLSGKVKPFDPNTSWQRGREWFGIQRLTQCGNRFDVVWTPGAILYHSKKGLFEEKLVDSVEGFGAVKWDGQYVWTVARNKELLILDESGEIVKRIGPEQGLPPFDGGLLIEPIRQGKVCIAGTFGSEHRNWLAMVEMASGSPIVNVFHTGTKVITTREDSLPGVVDFTFAPTWMHVYEDSNGIRDHLWVGSGNSSEHYPLLDVDLNTLKVGRPSFRMFLPGKSSFFNKRGEMLIAHNQAVLRYAGPGQAWPNGNAYIKLCDPKNHFETHFGGKAKLLLPLGDFIYVTGDIWFRINAVTMQTEQLSPDLVPQAAAQYYSTSAHYGLIGWDYRKPFRQFTVIEDGEKSDGELNAKK